MGHDRTGLRMMGLRRQAVRIVDSPDDDRGVR